MAKSNWSLSGAWKIPTNTFSLFRKKTKQSYGKQPTTSTKQAIEADEVVEDNNGNIKVENATSWDPETHPRGAGPSYLVDDINYNENTKDLTVKYRDGFVAVYHNMSRGDVYTFATASSKGRWAHNHLWDLPYDRG